MRLALIKHWAIFNDIFGRPGFRAFAILWAVLGTYDLVLSEIVPPKLAERWPKFYEVISMTYGWLPWWAWGWIGTAIFAVAVFEYAVRLHVRSQQVGATIKLAEIPEPAPPQSAISLKITGVRFDPNGPTEMYVHFELDNPGEPSRLRNWLLVVDAKDGSRLTGHPRLIETKTKFPAKGPPIHEDLTVSPLEKGGFRSGYITYTHSEPVWHFNAAQTVFGLSVEDVYGHKVSAEYVLKEKVKTV